jgi:nitrous oxidase accessory protein NosD
MKHKLTFSSLLVMAFFLALSPTALAIGKWYVDGVNGNDNNDCTTAQTACQTIGHAISLCSSGDSIMVAPAIYTENLTIQRSLKIVGSDAATTIVDGNQAGSVFTITNAKAHVHLSNLTIRNGSADVGGGINNYGTLTIGRSTVSGNSAPGWGVGGGITLGR